MRRAPGRVLNACAAAGIACMASEPVDAYTLRITVRARCAETAAELARRCRCEVKTLYRRGLPQLLAARRATRARARGCSWRCWRC
ncbi:MAG: sporulation protein YqfD [Oscillospiraceae bacterium]